MLNKKQPLLTLPFFLLCISTALFSGSFNIIIPELPDYLTSLGGAKYKGLIIGLFTISAGLSRPISGKLTDTVGRIPVMIIGTLVCVFTSLFYPFVTTVGFFLLLRFMHGFSTGFKPTASTAYVADIAPAARMGEAMGILGISMNLGASIAPPIGSFITMTWSLNMMFYVSSAMALISVLILLRLPETLKKRQPFKWSLLRISKEDFYDPSALAPAIVTVFTYAAFGVLLTIVPDQSTFVGLENKGLFFTSFTIASVSSRIFAGKLSDRFGPIPIMKAAGVLMSISLILLGVAYSPFTLLSAAAVVGFAAGMNSPAVFSWAILRCNPEHRGRAMATVYIALEIGIGMGAIVSAWIYANNYNNFGTTFFFFAGVALLAPLYLQLLYKEK